MRDSIHNRDWEDHYLKHSVEELPWYYSMLDPDIENALKNLHLTKGKILDIGAGPGTQSLALAQKGFHVTATDISVTALQEARRLAHSELKRMVFLED